MAPDRANGAAHASDRLPAEPQARVLAVVGAANGFIAVLLVIQMWLLSASLESYLGGHDQGALAGAIISGVLFLATILLNRFIDRASRRGAF
jgi:hypothetical protein